MRFTAQEEYGLRCMLQLAKQLKDGQCGPPGGERSLTIGEIAETEGITPQYAGKLIRILRMGGLLESVRGRHGGYRLARPVNEISVGEVLSVLGGRVFKPEYCNRYGGERKICVHTVDCTIRSLWGSLQETIEKILSCIKLRDLINSEKITTEILAPLAEAATTQFPFRPGHRVAGEGRGARACAGEATLGTLVEIEPSIDPVQARKD